VRPPGVVNSPSSQSRPKTVTKSVTVVSFDTHGKTDECISYISLAEDGCSVDNYAKKVKEVNNWDEDAYILDRNMVRMCDSEMTKGKCAHCY